jgi:hypothetical protein
MARNEARSMRRRGGGATTRGGEVDAEFSPTLHTNIQTFKDGIFYRDKDIRLEVAGGYYAHIGRTSSIILTDCLRVSGGVFDDRMRISTRDGRLRRGSKTKEKLYMEGCGIEP